MFKYCVAMEVELWVMSSAWSVWSSRDSFLFRAATQPRYRQAVYSTDLICWRVVRIHHCSKIRRSGSRGKHSWSLFLLRKSATYYVDCRLLTWYLIERENDTRTPLLTPAFLDLGHELISPLSIWTVVLGRKSITIAVAWIKQKLLFLDGTWELFKSPQPHFWGCILISINKSIDFVCGYHIMVCNQNQPLDHAVSLPKRKDI